MGEGLPEPVAERHCVLGARLGVMVPHAEGVSVMVRVGVLPPLAVPNIVCDLVPVRAPLPLRVTDRVRDKDAVRDSVRVTDRVRVTDPVRDTVRVTDRVRVTDPVRDLDTVPERDRVGEAVAEKVVSARAPGASSAREASAGSSAGAPPRENRTKPAAGAAGKKRTAAESSARPSGGGASAKVAQTLKPEGSVEDGEEEE